MAWEKAIFQSQNFNFQFFHFLTPLQSKSKQMKWFDYFEANYAARFLAYEVICFDFEIKTI